MNCVEVITIIRKGKLGAVYRIVLINLGLVHHATNELIMIQIFLPVDIANSMIKTSR